MVPKKSCGRNKVPEYTIRAARKLKEEKGIISVVEDTKSLVVNFFEDDEFSRLTVCRVKRTTLVFQGLSRNVHKQRRL
jgi:hypothetical protein